jgi:sulfite reductase (ferredoxin)
MDLTTELEQRLPDFDQPVSINVNGCPNSCARFQVADIGLKGSIVNGEEGFQVHLGGTMGALDAGQSFGRKVRGLKVTSAELTDYVERVLRRFDADRGVDESFAAWVQRAPEDALS